jgi:hypothetical protein
MDHASVTKVEHSSPRSRDFQIFLGLCVAALSAAVVWLALERHDHDGARIASLQRQVDGLRGQLAAATLAQQENTRATTARLQAQAAQLAALRAQSPALVSRCLGDIQQEIGDLRSFIASGGRLRRRVSPACTTLFGPRSG